MTTSLDESSQSWLISRMSTAGYNTTLKGCCFGIAHMANQAFIVGEIDNFYARLERLSQTPIEQFADDFSILRKEAKQLRNSGSTNDTVEADKIMDKIVDFKAFFDGLVLYQSPSAYPDLLPNLKKTQDAKQSIELTRSIAMEALGQVSIDHLDCLFSEQTLLNFFKILQTHLGEYSLSMVWGDNRHAVNISYDAISQEWVYTDANHLLSDDGHIIQKILLDPESIAGALSVFFKERLCVNLHLEINAQQENAAAMQSAYTLLKANTAYQRSYSQEALDVLFHFDQLPEQSGYEIFYFLMMQLISGSITDELYSTTINILFTKISPSEILEFMCLDHSPGDKFLCEYFIQYHQAIPSVSAMSCANPEILDVMLTAVSKLELEQQEAIFSQTDSNKDNIMMRIIFNDEQSEKILHRLDHFSDEFWEKMLTQTNSSHQNVLGLSALVRPECLPLFMLKMAKLPHNTQENILEPIVNILKSRVKSEKNPECKLDYKNRYDLLFEQLKKVREQTKPSVLQHATRFFRVNTGIETEKNKDRTITQSKNSPKSK